MSTTAERKERMTRLLDLLEKSKRSLTPNEIAARTGLITEITMERLNKYLLELEWCGMVFRQGNTFRAITRPPLKRRERERDRRKVK